MHSSFYIYWSLEKGGFAGDPLPLYLGTQRTFGGRPLMLKCRPSKAAHCSSLKSFFCFEQGSELQERNFIRRPTQYIPPFLGLGVKSKKFSGFSKCLKAHFIMLFGFSLSFFVSCSFLVHLKSSLSYSGQTLQQQESVSPTKCLFAFLAFFHLSVYVTKLHVKAHSCSIMVKYT